MSPRVYSSEYYQENKAAITDSVRRWRAANPEKMKAIRKAYREKNPERHRLDVYAWREKNPEKVREIQKAYKKRNPEKVSAGRRAYRERNPEKVRETNRKSKQRKRAQQLYLQYLAVCIWLRDDPTGYLEYLPKKAPKRLPMTDQERRERRRAYEREYALANPDKMREKRRRKKSRKLATPEGRLYKRISNGIREGLAGTSKSGTALEYIGLSDWESFRLYLESTWTDGMTWENYGNGDDKWNIHHIIARSHYDLTDNTQTRACWHYTNLMALWQLENNEISNNTPLPVV